MCEEIWVTSSSWHVFQAVEDQWMLSDAVASYLNESLLFYPQKRLWEMRIEVGFWIEKKDENKNVENQNTYTDAIETKRHTWPAMQLKGIWMWNSKGYFLNVALIFTDRVPKAKFASYWYSFRFVKDFFNIICCSDKWEFPQHFIQPKANRIYKVLNKALSSKKHGWCWEW